MQPLARGLVDARSGSASPAVQLAEAEAVIRQLQARVAELERENALLKEQVSQLQGGGGAPTVSDAAHARPPAPPRRSVSDGGVAQTASATVKPGASPAPSPAAPSPAPAGAAPESSCENCGKEIPPSALTMHKLHCARNVKRCEHCKAALSLREYDAHVAEKVVDFTGPARDAAFERVMGALAAGDVAKLEDMLCHGLSGAVPLPWPGRGAAGGGGEPDALRPEDGDTLLHAAVRMRQLDVIEFLLTRGGVSAGARTSGGETALHIACALPRQPAPPVLAAAAVAGSSSPGTASATGTLPALPAPLSRSSSMTGASSAESPRLVFSAADLAAPAAQQQGGGGLAGAAAAPAVPAAPALPSAAEIVALLLKRGCDTEARTALGDTPIHIAQRARNHDLVMLLSSTAGSGGAALTLAGAPGGPGLAATGRPPSRELRSLRPGSAGGSMRRGSFSEGLGLPPLGGTDSLPTPPAGTSLGIGIGLGAASLVRSSSGIFSSNGPVTASHRLPVTSSPPQQ